MFSNSSSYLGGSNSGRPGAPPYGQQSYGQPSAPSPFSSQQSGYGGGMPQLQPQATGYPGQLQSQPTGYPGQLQPQATGYPVPLQYQNQGNTTGGQQQTLQSQYTGFPGQGQQQYQQAQQQQQPQPPMQQQQQTPQAQAPQRLQSQPTGMTSAQMADSFRSSPAQPPSRAQAPVNHSNIPKQRLSFITAQDQGKFETLFRSAVGTQQVMSGDQARDLLLRSKLQGDVLSQIWYVWRPKR